MTSSSEDDEADVYKRKMPILDIFMIYLHKFTRNLPSFTGQIVILFCVLPVSFSLAVFLVTAIFNFGIAFIAQTISSVLILLILIPSLAICIVSAIATAYILQFTQNIYLRLSNSPSSSTSSPYSNSSFNRRSISNSPPPEYVPKFEIEEKLKTS